MTPSPDNVAAVRKELMTLSKGELAERLITALRSLEYANATLTNYLAQLKAVGLIPMTEEFYTQELRPTLVKRLGREPQHENVDEFLGLYPYNAWVFPVYGDDGQLTYIWPAESVIHVRP